MKDKLKEKKKAPAIEAININFQYNDTPVIENVSFAIGAGEYLGIIGPNGGGKTTLIKILLGLIQPSFGEVRIFGTPLEKFKNQSVLGYVPQKIAHGGSAFPATVEEVVRTGRIARIGILKNFQPSDDRAVESAIKIAGIEKLRNKRIGQLSGGQRQRVFIARALAGEPKILILDEPTVGVDISAQEKFYSFITDLNKTYGLTILFVSHDIDVIAHEASSVMCLNRTLISHGPPKSFLTEANLKKIYGKNVSFLLHDH
ncbi:zinc ABC transporter ATP-binding protein [Candidatus Peregrinibacteria bacterium CG11_big_fil_rev_8_21_14_0_20_46_8]|nr:MAG: zinc ABC transporter ATP-binding protein [Candidatus Peregrinibacteria bacterium CG11_big_fil_rev_8_21_14_0_20_46_8]